MARFVEGSAIRYGVGREVSAPGEGERISYVKFYLDGDFIGTANFPTYETVETQKKETFYEMWRISGIAEAISVAETSRAFYAVAYSKYGSQMTDSRLIRIIENQAPSVSFRTPESGASVTAGQTIDFVAASLGKRVELAKAFRW